MSWTLITIVAVLWYAFAALITRKAFLETKVPRIAPELVALFWVLSPVLYPIGVFLLLMEKIGKLIIGKELNKQEVP
jgi:hypothetical protein